MKRPIYLSFKNWLKTICDEPVFKITIDAGFSCPNRVNSDGCIFCDNTSFSPAHRNLSGMTIREQLKAGTDFGHSKNIHRFIAYFQAFTNTFAPIDELKRKYDQIIDIKEVIGFEIGTRPDCLGDEVLDLIESYNPRFPGLLFADIGMQTSNNKTLKQINRGHSHEQTVDTVKRCKERGILTVLHVILGLPGENLEDVKNTAVEIARLHPHSVKIHHLYIYDGTELARMYKNGEYTPINYSKYMEFASELISRIPDDIVIQRFLGELEGVNLLAPRWDLQKTVIIQDLCNYMSQKSLFQGSKLH